MTIPAGAAGSILRNATDRLTADLRVSNFTRQELPPVNLPRGRSTNVRQVTGRREIKRSRASRCSELSNNAAPCAAQETTMYNTLARLSAIALALVATTA